MPALAGLLIPAAVLFVGIFLVMLSQAHSSSVRPAAESSNLSTVLTAPLHLVVRVWERLVRATVSRFAASHLVPLVRWFSSLNSMMVLLTQTIADDQEAVAEAVETFRHKTLPREIHGAVNPVAKQARSASATAHGALTLARSDHGTLTAYRATTNARLGVQAHAIDVTLPRSIGQVRTREAELARDQAKLRERTKGLESGALKTFEWLRAHPLAGTTGVFAGAVAIALARLGYGFLRCNSWKGLGRRLTCGIGTFLHGLLDFAATYALATLAVLDPEAIARAAVSAIDLVEPVLERMLPVPAASPPSLGPGSGDTPA